jgi:hypothetical protein
MTNSDARSLDAEIKLTAYKTFNNCVLTMAVYERFEDLPVWQEAARLYN